MLLETLDIKKNDVIIYSQNIFNLEKNFRIVFKDDPQKISRKISFGDVCHFVNEYTPKNLIVYRILTNLKNFEIYPPKFGFYVNINDVTELIYFDPIFAVKEIEEYSIVENYPELRFRIQQVGLTTLNRKGDSVNFAEIYSVDLMATEAKFQNDKIFAEAILSFIKVETPKVKNKISSSTTIASKNIDLKNKKPQPEKVIKPVEKPVEKKEPEKIISVKEKINEINPLPKVKVDAVHKDGIRIISHDVSEDKDFDYKEIMRINFRGAASAKKITKADNAGSFKKDSEAIPRVIMKDDNKSEFGKFLQRSHSNAAEKNNHNENAEEKDTDAGEIFKSSGSLSKFLKEREHKQVVLKFNKK